MTFLALVKKLGITPRPARAKCLGFFGAFATAIEPTACSRGSCRPTPELRRDGAEVSGGRAGRHDGSLHHRGQYPHLRDLRNR